MMQARDYRSWEARLAAANAASEAKDWRRAAELWEQLRTERPHDAGCWVKAGEAYCQARMLESAERILGEAVTLFPQHPWLAYHHMIAARYAGDWPEVLRRAEKLRQAAPEFWPAWLEAADALTALGRLPEADRRRREAAKRFPAEFWPNYAVARIEAEQSDPQGAVRTWSALVERFPKQPAAAEALRAAADIAGQPREPVGAQSGAELPGARASRPGEAAGQRRSDRRQPRRARRR